MVGERDARYPSAVVQDIVKVLLLQEERAWRTDFRGCCLPVFRLTSASYSGNFFFFFFLSQRAGVVLGHWEQPNPCHW